MRLAPVGIILCLFVSSCSDDEGPRRVSGNEAYVGCQGLVKNRLKSPSSAEFPTFGFQDHVREVSPQSFRIESYVDAQNSFGASIRTPWECEVTFVDGNAQNVKLWIDGVAQQQ